MDEEDISLPDSPTDSGSMSPSHYDKQRATLQTYLDHIPFECEPLEYMQAKLDHIVARIAICAESKNWLVLTTWDGMLQCWLLMRYPMPKSTRAKLVRLYYEMCLVPGMEPRVIRSWADMLSRLCANKSDKIRKLESFDLQLDWRSLWRVLKRELWPKKRLQDTSRNMLNILLFVAEQCKRYFPSSEIPDMLSTFIPLLTKDSVLTMIPVMTSFLPPTHTHLYMPSLFKIWEAFNSSVIDDRLIELCGELSEEHVAGTDNDSSESGAAEWKDIGIWSEAEWSLLSAKALGSMNVPVGVTRGSSTTASHADILGDKQSLRIKKPINRYHALAKMFVYSMSLDGPIRVENDTTQSGPLFSPQPSGFLAGSRALDSLDKLITSAESFFHPSNSGVWSLGLTIFLHRLTSEFCKRWKEEQQPNCKTPVTRRLTPAIRRAFVTTLRTPALLSLFSKDPFSMGFSQAALRCMAFVEPDLIMPDLLDRAYSGLEVVNETHRTTSALTMLAGVSLPLVSEKLWLGGQKHVVPLLEMCIPGIDLNDPIKTVCAASFIASVVQFIKIGDLSMHTEVPLSSDAPAEEQMDVDDDASKLPNATVAGTAPVLSRDDERALVRDSTAGFADWVTSLFRRVLALFENLPEEGGKKNTTGGKMEETVIKSIKNTMDLVCLHLSDPLFDLVLKLVYEYGTTNAKSNAVRAFGQLVSCLARVKPEKTIDKFLPFCVDQIREELKHGASSIRTTSTHTAVPSDTTLHWNMSILRGCFGYAGEAVLKYKSELMELMDLLIEKTKSERGYSGTGRLLNRVMHTVSSITPISTRFLNPKEWNDPAIDHNHLTQWGKFYEAKDVELEWHVPSQGEIDFVLEVLDRIAAPALDKVEALLETAGKWDNVARNDFCRYLHAVRSIWSGLPTFIQEGEKDVVNPCINEGIEFPELLVSPLKVQAGFVLTDSSDPRYQRALAHRTRFGMVIHRAAQALQEQHEGEDHIDAVIGVSKAIDVFLLEHGMTRGSFDSMRRSYTQSRDSLRIWPKQKEHDRIVFIRRAQAYLCGRIYMHALYRRRSQLDDDLLQDLIGMSLSPYTRVRRHAQAILHNACGYFVRSTRFCLPYLFQALAKGTDPDRMKGALYALWNKGTAAYALADLNFGGQYLVSLLECQHQEKPSIQKLVGNLTQDALAYLTEEAIHTDAFVEDTPGVMRAVQELKGEVKFSSEDEKLLAAAISRIPLRASLKNERHESTVQAILDIAERSTTHWRYVQIAAKFLHQLLRRDFCPSPALATFFLRQSISPHPTIRLVAQRSIIKLTAHIKIRTFSGSSDELWLEEWSNPLQTTVRVPDPDRFIETIEQVSSEHGVPVYVDKIRTGFLTWSPDGLKGYRAVEGDVSPFRWEEPSQPVLQAMRQVLDANDFFPKVGELWGQESSKTGANPELRQENVTFIKSLAKMFEAQKIETMTNVIETMLADSDRFKQRAGAEILAGILRGSKHWPKPLHDHIWAWASAHLDNIFAQIKPDTMGFWESMINEQLADRDPRRAQPIIDWILSLPLEFHGDSAFQMNKSLTLFNVVIDCLGPRFLPLADKYVHLFLDNANTGYAEIRSQIAQNICAIVSLQWRPAYPSADAFIKACHETADPLHIREAKYMDRVMQIAEQLPRWKEERLPPPRVSQSQYDKVGLTLLLWIWDFSHGPQAPLVFPYTITLLPEILRMSELNDSSELQTYSSGVLYVLSAVNPVPEYVETIADNFIDAIKSSSSWRIRVKALPTLIVFFYRNLLRIPPRIVSRLMEALLECLADENIEVREMASKMLSGVVRCSQRQSIPVLKNHFVNLAKKTRLPSRGDPNYATLLRTLHSAILGLCALIESFPYSVEPWMPSLTDVLALHATDPVPISTTIRKCASEFKKTHQDTWHKDQLAFNEDQLQNLSTMLVGTSYYA
ncbi:ARM repeat-containing protein [Obba rivulosa]|uniref:ARM repeat-containing protein n=1 Tax=Obba rivulosa TaxID=1052685 RepID=A0A8E2DVW1_9APHY|nr:ARM repeat-containing protein [Obba rivulosa]